MIHHHFNLKDQIDQDIFQDREILPDLVQDRLSPEYEICLKFFTLQFCLQVNPDLFQGQLLKEEEEILLKFLILIHADFIPGEVQMFHRMILQPTNQDVNPDLVQDHQLKEEEIRRIYMNFQGQIIY